MALIQFENLPSTNTPINAENLNNNFEYFTPYARFYVYKGSAGGAWYHIATFSHSGEQLSFDVEGFSNAPNVSDRGDWKLRIDFAGTNNNSISATLLYGNRGINTSHFRLYRSSDFKTLDLYFYMPQWTRYEFVVYNNHLIWQDELTVTEVLTAETPSGNTEISIYSTSKEYARLYANNYPEVSGGSRLPFNTLDTNNSQKFTYSGNSIVIGKGVSNVEVSATIWYYAGATTRQWVNISKNNETVSTAITYNNGAYNTITITSRNISVSEGDTLYVYVSSLEGSGNITINSGSANPSLASYLFVKEL